MVCLLSRGWKFLRVMSDDLRVRFCFSFERMKSPTSTLSGWGAAGWRLGLAGSWVMVLLKVEICLFSAEKWTFLKPGLEFSALTRGGRRGRSYSVKGARQLTSPPGPLCFPTNAYFLTQFGLTLSIDRAGRGSYKLRTEPRHTIMDADSFADRVSPVPAQLIPKVRGIAGTYMGGAIYSNALTDWTCTYLYSCPTA